MENITIGQIARFLELFAGIIGSITIITPIILKNIKNHVASNVEETLEPLKNGVLSLIRSQIVTECEIYTKQGFLPEYQRYSLEELFNQYKALGGNHGIEALVYECYKLPLNKKEEKK